MTISAFTSTKVTSKSSLEPKSLRRTPPLAVIIQCFECGFKVFKDYKLKSITTFHWTEMFLCHLMLLILQQNLTWTMRFLISYRSPPSKQDSRNSRQLFMTSNIIIRKFQTDKALNGSKSRFRKIGKLKKKKKCSAYEVFNLIRTNITGSTSYIMSAIDVVQEVTHLLFVSFGNLLWSCVWSSHFSCFL